MVSCWGKVGAELGYPPAIAFSQISAGWNYACGLDSTGKEWCWGSIARQPF
jgi:hypothetical protein